MAFTDSAHDYIKLHRENATLHAQLSSANETIGRLRDLNRHLIEELANSLQNRRTPNGVAASPFPTGESFNPPNQGNHASLDPKPQKTIHAPHRSPSDVSDSSTDDSPSVPLTSTAPRFHPQDLSPHRRTILITNIPEHVTLKELTTRIRGGAVLSMSLLSTSSIGGGQTCIVIFVAAASATAFIQYNRRRPITFYSKSPVAIAQQPHVSLLPTPTTPIFARTFTNINDYGATRCISIRQFPPRLTLAHLRAKLNPHAHTDMTGIIQMVENGPGAIHVEFESVDRASSAKARINAYRCFAPAVADFAADPCASVWINPAVDEVRPKEDGATRTRSVPLSIRPRPHPMMRLYHDRDALPRDRGSTELEYGEDNTVKRADNSSGRRAKLVDYSDLCERPEKSGQQGNKDGKSKKSAELSRRSSLESGEILSAQATPKEDSSLGKKIPNLMDSDVENSFYPIVNRHLGPAPEKPRADANLPSSISSSSTPTSKSDTDSVESRRAKARRHADEILAEMQKKVEPTDLDY